MEFMISDEEIGEFGGGGDAGFEEGGQPQPEEYNTVEDDGNGTQEKQIVPHHSDKNMVVKEKPNTDVRDREETSIRSTSSASSNLKNKIHVDLEITILPEGLLTPEPDTPNPMLQNLQFEIGKPKIHIDHPEGLVVTLNANARIEKLKEFKANAQEELDDSIAKGWKNDDNDKVTDIQNQDEKKGLNSTFVRPPFSSTFIFPIIEETEPNAAKIENQLICPLFGFGQNKLADESIARSNSGQSIYKTVLNENEFGNISAISKTSLSLNDRDKPLESPLSSSVDFKNHPSLILNSKSQLSKAKNLSPVERLMQELHKISRYRGVWGVFEDESRIEKQLQKINELLGYIDSDTIRNIIQNDFEEIKDLISYFNLEKRFNIRSHLLHTFSIFSQKSVEISQYIFASDVPATLANEVAAGDFASNETHAFASCLVQMISSQQLSKDQLENFGETFYNVLIEMIHRAQNHYYGRMADLLFDILLAFHEQIDGRVDDKFKWDSLFHCAILGNRSAMLRIKQKLMHYVMRSSAHSDPENINHAADRRMKQAVIILHDWILYKATRGLFNDSELDILLVTLTHSMEQRRLIGVHVEAAKLMHRILRSIKTEPSGIDKMLRLIENLVMMDEAIGEGITEKSYRAVLRKIFKILTYE